MKCGQSRVCISFLAFLLWCCLPVGCPKLAAQIIVYQNDTTINPTTRFSEFEFGDEIVLAGNRPRMVAGFGFDYYGDFTSSNATAVVSFYKNDGVNVGVNGKTILAPGTLLYQSDPVKLTSGFHEQIISDIAINVPASFTWTVTFFGLSGQEGDRAGLLYEDPPTIGKSFDDFWENQNGVWGIYRTTAIGLVSNFGAIVSVFDDYVALPALTNLTILKNTSTAVIPFTMTTAVTNPGPVTVTGTSDNQTLVPNSAIHINGGLLGLSQSFQITPASNQVGTAKITLNATATNGFSTSGSFTLQVTEAASPITFSSIPDQHLLPGQSTPKLPFQVSGLATVGGFGGVTFSSSDKTVTPDFDILLDGDVNTGQFNVQVTTLAHPGETTITLKFTGKSGVSGSTSFKVSTLPDPTLEPPVLAGDGPTNGVLRLPYQFQFHAEKGTPPYTWSLPPGDTLPAGLGLGATNGLLSGTPTNAGVFEVAIRVTDQGGLFSDGIVNIAIDSPPVIASQPIGKTVLPGGDAAFSAYVKGASPLRYQWRREGQDLPGETNRLLLLTSIQPQQRGAYSLVITNSLGSVTSRVARLAVLEPPVIVTAPQSQNAVVGAGATLQVAANGNGPFRYQWFLNGQAILNQTNASLSLNGLQPADSGDYSVQVEGAFGTVASAPARLTVQAPSLAFANNFADRGRIQTSAGVGRGSNVGADQETGEPNHGGLPARKSVWTTWVAPANGVVSFSTRGSTFDTTLAVYTGNTLPTLAPVASDSDDG
ncbi:MAG TPA: immunoglobulin domain-containing protein, partial [Verrucomicrobiae bacterium]|nr:immunoglobulin domain-containing protein [Verrucomicrobiae bacterium]